MMALLKALVSDDRHLQPVDAKSLSSAAASGGLKRDDDDELMMMN